jgi:uncharacterized membrane protein HdeD (DUF308 family)
VDDGPLDRLHQLVPPLEVTAAAGVCVGLFAFGRMIFRAPIALTILGGFCVLAFDAFHEGMSLYELWGAACGLVILVVVIFMVGFFCTGQPLLGLALLGFLILFEKILPKQSPDILVRMIQSDHVNVVAPAADPASSHWGWLWLVGIVAAVVGVVIYACVCDRKERNSPLF